MFLPNKKRIQPALSQQMIRALDYADTSKASFVVSLRQSTFIMPMLHGLPLLYPGLLGINRRLHGLWGMNAAYTVRALLDRGFPQSKGMIF